VRYYGSACDFQNDFGNKEHHHHVDWNFYI
jgi:hypothetical protein